MRNHLTFPKANQLPRNKKAQEILTGKLNQMKPKT